MGMIKSSKIGDEVAPLEVEEQPQAKMMELEDLDDLLQAIVSMDNHDLHVYHMKRGEEHLYLVWFVIHDFYTLNGLPLVIFVRLFQEPTRFIKYKPDSGKIEFVDKVEEPSAAYIKVIKVKQLPFCLDLTL